jgi:ABC-type polysaccharide/polyol phosphate export permease
MKRRLRLRDLRGIGQIVRVLTTTNLRAKYKQSALGPLWLVIQPLALLTGFMVGFGGLLGAGSVGNVPYVLFTLVGLSVWSFFQSAMGNGATSVTGNAPLVVRTACPRLAFPISSVLATLPNLTVTLSSSLILAVAMGQISVRVLLLPLGIAWLLLLTIGVVFTFSAMVVRLRDIVGLIPLFLQTGVFLTPTAFPLERLSPTARFIVELNPVTGIVEAWRWMILEDAPVHGLAMAISGGGTLLLLLVGWRVFVRNEVSMADAI